MKKSFAVEPWSFIAALASVFFCAITIAGMLYGDKLGDRLSAVTIGGILTLLFIFITIIIPKLYVADEEGLSIYYLPNIKDYYKWEDIKRINVVYSIRRIRMYSFETNKSAERASKISFFKDSEFHKTISLKRLINKYWQGEVEGDDWDNLKKKIRERKKKNNFKLDGAEVENAEKQAKKKTKEIIKANKPLAEASGKFIKATYTYETKGKASEIRPIESYSYNVEIEIGEFGSSEDDRLYIMAELLFVRYGKKDIKVIPDEAVYDKISRALVEALDK